MSATTTTPIAELNTPCPACNGTIIALTLLRPNGQPDQLRWAGRCPECGAQIAMIATTPREDQR